MRLSAGTGNTLPSGQLREIGHEGITERLGPAFI